MPNRARAAFAWKTLTGSAFPFTVAGSNSSYSNTTEVASNVERPTATPISGATDCNRDAVLIASPANTRSPTPAFAPRRTSVSPVFTPTRNRSGAPPIASNSSAASTIRNPARTARSGSSSCAAGTPNTPTTASPMNFSTTPPCASIRARAISAYADSIVSTSSGSACSDAAVNPTRSQNNTDTTFRSSADRTRAFSQRTGALHAEPRAIRILITTRRTGRHRTSLRHRPRRIQPNAVPGALDKTATRRS